MGAGPLRYKCTGVSGRWGWLEVDNDSHSLFTPILPMPRRPAVCVCARAVVRFDAGIGAEKKTDKIQKISRYRWDNKAVKHILFDVGFFRLHSAAVTPTASPSRFGSSCECQ